MILRMMWDVVGVARRVVARLREGVGVKCRHSIGAAHALAPARRSAARGARRHEARRQRIEINPCRHLSLRTPCDWLYCEAEAY